MIGNRLVSREENVTSLFEYVTAVRDSPEMQNVFSARNECLIAKHTLESGIILYERMIQDVKRKSENGEVSHEAYALLSVVAGKLRADISEMITILKKGAEIEVLTSSNYDALQVIALLENVPKLVSETFDESLTAIIEEIVISLEEDVSTTESKKIKFKNQFLNEITRKVAVASAVNHITSALHEGIARLGEQVGVARKHPSTDEYGGAVIQEQVIAMMETVPQDPKEALEEAFKGVRNEDLSSEHEKDNNGD